MPPYSLIPTDQTGVHPTAHNSIRDVAAYRSPIEAPERDGREEHSTLMD
jgi:hypothetical protein